MFYFHIKKSLMPLFINGVCVEDTESSKQENQIRIQCRAEREIITPCSLSWQVYQRTGLPAVFIQGP
jgi:hypothetical protein